MTMKQELVRKKTKMTTREDKNSTFDKNDYFSLSDTESKCFPVQLSIETTTNFMNWFREDKPGTQPSFWSLYSQVRHFVQPISPLFVRCHTIYGR